MLQIRTFNIQAGSNQPIGPYIDKEINPILASLSNAKIVSASVEMAGSFQKATVIVSYEAQQDIAQPPQEDSPRRGRPPKSVKEE